MAISKEDAIRELYKRGELPPEQKSALDELIKRGEFSIEGEAYRTEPFALPSKSRLIFRGDYEEPLELSIPAQGAEIAATGVDVTTGAPGGVRAKAAFAKNENSKIAYIEDQLGAPVRKGPVSDQPEYLRYDEISKEKVWTLVDESRLTARDFGEGAEALPPIAAGVASGAAGLSGWGAPAIGLAGGGAAAVTEAARLGVGEMLGVNDVSTQQYVTDAAETGAYEFLLGYGGEKFMKLMQFARRALQPLASTPDEAADILRVIEDSQSEKLAAEVEAMARQVNPDARLRPTTAELSNEESLLAIEAGAVSGDRDAAVELGKRVRGNTASLEDAFDSITLQTDDGGDAYRSAKQVQRLAEKRVESRTGQAARGLEERTAAAKAETAAMQSIDEQEAGRRMRAAVLGAKQVAKNKETAAYNAYKQAYGWDGYAESSVKIEKTDRWNNFWSGVNQEKVNSWFGHQKSAKGKIIPGFEKKVKDDTIKLYSPDGSVLSSISKSSSKPLDLHQLEEGLKALRKLKRGKKPASADANDIGRAIKELEILRRDSVSPEMLEFAAYAERASTERVAVADKGLLNALISETNGRYVLSDTRVFAHVLKTNDSEIAEQFMRVIEPDPGAVAATKRAVAGFYKKTVAQDGYADPKLHEAFMRDHGNTLSAIFSPAEIKRMNALGDVGAVVQRSIKQYDNLVKGLEKTFYGKVKNTNPESLARMMFSEAAKKGSGFSVRESRQLMQMMDNYGAGDHVRKAVGDFIKNKAFKGGKVNFSSLTNLASGESRMKLSAIYGADYIRNVDKILDVAAMLSRKPNKPVPWKKTNALTDLLRVVVAPPLTRRGRAQTLLVNVRFDSANKALVRALLDPEELKNIVRLGNHQANSRQAARILAQLGGGMALQDVNDYNDESVERNAALFEKLLEETE